MRKIKVLSLNCYGIPFSLNKETRFRLIAKEIMTLRPSLVMLQEVIFASDRRILETELLNEGYQFFPKRHNKYQNCGLVTLVKNLDVDDFVFKRFRKQAPFSLLSLGELYLGRGLLFIKIKTKNIRFSLINTHLLWRHGETSENGKVLKTQKAQVEEIIRFAKANGNYPIILGGDLNTLPGSSGIVNLKNKLDLNDYLADTSATIDPANLNRGRLANLFGPGRPLRTDYLLFSPSIKVAEEKVIFDKPINFNNRNTHLSDHFGVLAEIEI